MKLLERRKTALATLETQLARGTKPRKNGKMFSEYPQEDVLFDRDKKPYGIKLSDKDRKRIQGEIDKLKSKIKVLSNNI